MLSLSLTWWQLAAAATVASGTYMGRAAGAMPGAGSLAVYLDEGTRDASASSSTDGPPAEKLENRAHLKV